MARYRLFPLYNFHGDIADPSIAYPKRQEIVPIYASILLSIFTPFFVYLVIFAFVRSFWDLNNAVCPLAPHNRFALMLLDPWNFLCAPLSNYLPTHPQEADWRLTTSLPRPLQAFTLN